MINVLYALVHWAVNWVLWAKYSGMLFKKAKLSFYIQTQMDGTLSLRDKAHFMVVMYED